MSLRYVVLEHTVNGDVHFDLMLEVEGQDRLRTIQLSGWPLAPGERCNAKELAPHRRAYLDYEGEVSGDRGVVRRVERGQWRAGNADWILEPEGGAVMAVRFVNGGLARR